MYKFTMIFNQPSNVSYPGSVVHRIGGWTESWYSGLATADAILSYAKMGPTGGSAQGLLPARAALLGLGASIIGYRIQLVGPGGGSASGSVLYAGDASTPVDVPQMALLYTVPALAATNVRRATLRGIPDQYVTEGETNFGGAFNNKVLAYFASLVGWNIRGRDLSQAAVKILSISAAGLVQTETPHALNINDMVRVLRTIRASDNDQAANVRTQVLTLGPGSNALTLTGWTQGVCKGGYIRKDGVVFPTVNAPGISASRIVVRKVGRPFIQYRGRRSSQS